MSHPLYNPYVSRNQSSTLGQYGLSSIQPERDPRLASRLGPGSSSSSSGTSSANSDNSGGTPSSVMSQSMSYMPEQGITTIDEDLKRSVDMHISRASEEVRVLHQHQSIDQDTRFTSTQRPEFQSLGTGMVSYPMCSTSPSLGHRLMEIESGRTSLVWSSNYKRPTPDDSKFYSPSVSSNSASGKDDRFSPHSEIERGMQSIPGLGDYDRPVPDRTVAPTEPIQPKYTSESAANILLHFGLEKEDLEHLICYPEDQITPANLPYIMREIRIKKAKMATTKVQDKPYPKPQPSHSLSSSASSAVLQPSQVIEYGHTSKCTGRVGAEIGRISASGANSGGDEHMLLSDIYVSNSQEPLQEKNTTGVNSSVLGNSAEQESSVTSLSSSYSPGLNSVAPPCHDQTKQLQTQSNQTSQTNLNSFVLPKKDTDLRVLESEASEPVPVKEPEADCQSTSKTQPPCTPLFRGVYPDRPALVLIGSNNTGTKDQSKNQGKESTVPKQMKKQQIQQFKKPEEQELKWPVLQPGQAMWPPVFSSAKLVPPAPLNPITTDASQGMWHPIVLPDDARSMVIPPVLPPVISNLMHFSHMKPGPSNKQPLAVSKGIPVTATFHDCIATTPRTFPHTCSLCNKECTHMKDWITHQNSSLHLENCKLLRSGLTSKNVKSLASTSAQTFQNRHQKNSRGSRSRSRSSSPIRRRGLEGRRERRRSLSRSPHRSKYAHRSRSRSSSRSSSSSRSRSRSPRYYRRIPARYRSRSRSPERRSSPRRKDERRSSPRRNNKRRSSPRRNDKRQSSPRRSDKRRSSPRRSDERRSSPRRNDERRSSPRRNDERRSSPRRNDERRSSPRRSDKRRSSPRRSHERQSTEGSSPQRKKLSNAEKLAKKLLETSAVQSLSKQSDLDTVVKTLAPLLVELTKIKSSSSNSSLSSSEGKEPSLSPAGGKRSSSTVSFSSPQKSESDKPSPLTMVRQGGVYRSLPYADLTAAVEKFGKTKSVVKYRSSLEAIVHFEKEKDAKKLRCVKTFNVKRLTVNVVREKETDLNKQENPPQKKPDNKEKVSEEKAAKAVSVPSKSTASENHPGLEPKHQAKLHEADRAEDDEQVQFGETGVKVAEPMEVGSCADDKGKKLTIGENLEKRLLVSKIAYLAWDSCLSMKHRKLGGRNMFITQLPKYNDGSYTEHDVAKLLMPFGFQYLDERIYVVPQKCMAIIRVPKVKNMLDLVTCSKRHCLRLRSSIPLFHVVCDRIPMTPIGFYKWLMRMMESSVLDDGMKIVLIKNISPTEANKLREALRKIFFLKNYLPLLNKVFVEFKSCHDADLLGVWHSLMKRPPGYELQRVKRPNRHQTERPPRLRENAIPDSEDLVAGAIIRPIISDVPQGSMAPFWVMMRTRPFLYPTLFPWFIIPDYLTIRGKDDIEKAGGHSSMFPTIMLTGLPVVDYKHEDVAKLVWDYFPKQNLESLYYNVTVLPLQRRAFVYFPDWTSCRKFLQDHITNAVPVKISHCMLSVHFILEQMNPESSEEKMYKTLMKLSNAGVPEEESLEERLLCVEISKTSVDVVKMVMEIVASVATFVNFLPLANRICVEMADSSGVTQVVEKYNTYSPNNKTHVLRSTVKHFETLKSLKQRLQDSSELTIKFEPHGTTPSDVAMDTSNLKLIKRAIKKKEGENIKSAATVKVSMGTDLEPLKEQAKAIEGAVAKSDHKVSAESIAAKSVESETKLETSSEMHPPREHGEEIRQAQSLEMNVNVSTLKDQKINKEEGKEDDADKRIEDKEDENDSENYQILNPCDDRAEEQMDDGGRDTILVQDDSCAVKQLSEEDANPDIDKSDDKFFDSGKDERPSNRSGDPAAPKKEETEKSPKKQDKEVKKYEMRTKKDTTAGVSKDTEEMVYENVDSVEGEPVQDAVTTERSGRRKSARGKKEDKITLKPSETSEKPKGDEEATYKILDSVEEETSDDEPTVTTRSTGAKSKSTSKKAASLSSASESSPENSTDSSETTKSPTKPSSSAPSLSTEIPSSPGQKTQQSKTASSSNASNTASSGRSTRSSSAAREREKITSTATVEVSMGTPKPLREEARVTESAVTVSDHKASAESTAAKTETEIETSSERHSPSQEQGVELSQGQSLEIVNVNTLKDQKKSKEEGKKDDADKHIEDDDNIENYQILDSVDDQTDEQIEDGNEDDSSKIQQTRPEKGQTVGDEGKACPEEDSEMEINSPFQVLDSVTEDQAAMSQEDSHLVQDDDSTLKKLSEEGATPVVDKSEGKDAVGKDQETNDKDHFQVSDTCSVQALGGKGDGENKRHKEEEEVKLVSAESCKAFKDVETPDDQILNEDQPVQDNDNKDHDSDVTEQETFEILDSIDDQTATEDDGQKHETDEISKEEVSPREEDQDFYQVIDSLEDQPTTTEPESETDKKGKRTKRGEATATKDERPSRRSGPTTRASKSEETEKSPKKEDRTVKKYETVSEGLEDEDATYKVLDSVEEETADDEPIATRRSTRGKTEKTSKDTPTRTRQTPARESQERNRETQKKGERAPSRHSTPTKCDVVVGELSEEVTYEMYEDKAKDDQPTTGGKRKRGRPKKEVKMTKKDIVTLKKEDKDTSEKAAEEEEATYQILDSVEDKTIDGQPPSDQSRKNATSLMGPTKNEEEELIGNEECTSKTDIKKEDKSTTKSRRGTATPEEEKKEKSPEKNNPTLVTLDEAGDEKDEEPDEEQAEKTSRSAKRKHDGDTEENMNFVTIDEVGEVEEEEEKEAVTVTTRTRGRAKKRSRQTPVRKSARGKKVSTDEEKEAADVPPPTSSSHLFQSVVSKQRSELVGPEPKRSRSQSPCVAADFKMPTFKPNNPLGQEFVVPKSGYFCNICSAFYVNENTAKELHCSSRRHYDNLQKHYEKLKQKPSRSSTQSPQDSVSD